MSLKLFKWKHFEKEIILFCVRWYLKYPFSYRNLVDMMAERGLVLTHITIMCWVHQYSPIIDEKIRKYLKQTNGWYIYIMVIIQTDFGRLLRLLGSVFCFVKARIYFYTE